MVVQGILALALALPTGLLFGVGYGTGVRIGYEQVYPLLFPQDKDNRNVTPTVENIKKINGIYNAIGGKEASQMGIAMGLNGAMEEINKNPDFRALEELELRLSGRTQSRLGQDSIQSKQISILASESDSSLSGSELATSRNQIEFRNRQEAVAAEAARKLIPSSKVLSASQDPVYLTWIAKLGKLKAEHQRLQSQINSNSAIIRKSPRSTHPDTIKARKDSPVLTNQKRAITSQIRLMSNDYRNPNNHIRENALRLRRAMASGQWK